MTLTRAHVQVLRAIDAGRSLRVTHHVEELQAGGFLRVAGASVSLTGDARLLLSLSPLLELFEGNYVPGRDVLDAWREKKAAIKIDSRRKRFQRGAK